MEAKETDALRRAHRAQQRIIRSRHERDNAICEAYAAGASLNEIARWTEMTPPGVVKIVRREQERLGSILNPLTISFRTPEPTTEAEHKLAALIAEGQARVAAAENDGDTAKEENDG